VKAPQNQRMVGIEQKLEELHSQFSNFWVKASDKILAQPSFYHN
jgi:hypothetical protein